MQVVIGVKIRAVHLVDMMPVWRHFDADQAALVDRADVIGEPRCPSRDGHASNSVPQGGGIQERARQEVPAQAHLYLTWAHSIDRM